MDAARKSERGRGVIGRGVVRGWEWAEMSAVTHLQADEWYIAPVLQSRAAHAIEKWHYAQGCPNTSVARHGLFREDDPSRSQLQGVAMWLPPTPRAARSVHRDEWRGVLALTRLVVAPGVPTNGASFLLGASMRALNRDRWPWLLTYADTGHGHTGAIYKATNWLCVGTVPAGDTWIGPGGEQRGRKRGDKNYTYAEMRSMGFELRPTAYKIKFVHHSEREHWMVSLKRAWSAETSAVDEWPADRPSTGQCAPTALIVQDRLGGKLLRAVNEGISHYWNQLPSGGEVDLTRDQFDEWEPDEIIERDREYVLSFPDTVDRYELLRERMIARRVVTA